MSSPNSERSARFKGSKSKKSTRRPQELNTESGDKSQSDVPISIKIDDVLEDLRNQLTQLRKQNNELKKMMAKLSEQIIQVPNQISKKMFLTDKLGQVTDETPQFEPNDDIGVNDCDEIPVRGNSDLITLLTDKSEENPKPEEGATSKKDSESEVEDPFQRTYKYPGHFRNSRYGCLKVAGPSQPTSQNTGSITNKRGFRTSYVLGSSPSKLIYEKNVKKSRYSPPRFACWPLQKSHQSADGFTSKNDSEINCSPQSISMLAGVVINVFGDENLKNTNGSKMKSPTHKSGTTWELQETQESVTNSTSSPKPVAINGSRVIKVSETKNTDTLESSLNQSNTDCGELEGISEESIISNTKFSIHENIPEPEKGVALTNQEFENKQVPPGTKQTLLTESSPPKILQNEKVKPCGVSSLTASPRKMCFLCNEEATIESCEKCRSKRSLPKEEIPGYCGEVHQKLHLTAGHGDFCGKKALKLGWKEVRGSEGINNGLPYYVATKELEPGHTIFTKKPLLIVPKRIELQEVEFYFSQFPQLKDYMSGEKLDYCRICIVCKELMVYGALMKDLPHGIRLNKCPSCEWPVHSPLNDVDGQKLNNNYCLEEHKRECKIFMENNLTWNEEYKETGVTVLGIGVLRAVLNEEIKQKLLALPVPSRLDLSFEHIHKFVREDCKQDQVSEEELNKIIHVLISNALPSSAGYFSIRKKICHTIYEGGHTGRILPHSCNPNCSIHVNPKTGVATFKTRRKVKLDEIFTINYLVDAFPQPIHQRALSLKTYHIDHCSCSKCKDGQDVTSAMKRLEGGKKHKKGCKSKYLMPYSTRLRESEQDTSTTNQDHQNEKNKQQVLDMSNLYFWQCESCKNLGPEMEQSVVQQKVEKIVIEIGEAFRNIWHCGYKYNEELKKIIRKYSDVDVHPDHSTMLLAHVALGYFAVLEMRMVDISEDENKRIEFSVLLDNAIKMLNRNENGRTEIYGTLLYHHTLLEMTRLAQKMQAGRKKPNLSQDEMKTTFDSINKNLEESWEIIKDNPFLSGSEINGHIALFDIYSKTLEPHVKGLVESSEGSTFVIFRTQLTKRLKTAHAFANGSLWVYGKVKSKGNDDSVNTMDADDAEPGEVEKGFILKKEFKPAPNKISTGAFIHKLYYFH